MKVSFSRSAISYLLLLLPAGCFMSCSENKTSNAQATGNPDSLEGKQVYLNPADGKAYSSAGAFKSYGPEGGVVPQYGPAVLKKVILLTDEHTLEQVVDIDTLDHYFSVDSNTLSTVLKDYKKEGELLIQFTLYAGKKPQIIVSYDGDFDKATLQQVNDQLNRNCSYYRVRKDSCTYQALYHTGSSAPVSKTGRSYKQEMR